MLLCPEFPPVAGKLLIISASASKTSTNHVQGVVSNLA